MIKIASFFCMLSAILIGISPSAFAQNSDVKTVTVATRIVPPFVMNAPDSTAEKPHLTGFSIELWEAIAKELNLETRYVLADDVGGILRQVKSGKSTAGIAAISITAERDRDFDFSQPIYGAGLQILAPDAASSPLRDAIKGIFSPDILKLLGIAFVLALVAAHIIYLIERKKHVEWLEGEGYLRGIGKSLWWAAATLATQAEEMPKSPLGRAFAILWMFGSVLFVAYFTATVTASLTVQQIQGTIKSVNDLPGKNVGTVKGSTSESYLKDHGVPSQTYDKIEKAFDALSQKQLDAVVYDVPVLLYYAAHDGKGSATVVGTIFRKEDYGIVFLPANPLRKRVNQVLLKLKENGDYDQINQRWFGQGESK